MYYSYIWVIKSEFAPHKLLYFFVYFNIETSINWSLLCRVYVDTVYNDK